MPVASCTRSAYGAMARRCGTVLGRYVVPAPDEARHVRSGSSPASVDAASRAAGRQAPKRRRAEPGCCFVPGPSTIRSSFRPGPFLWRLKGVLPIGILLSDPLATYIALFWQAG